MYEEWGLSDTARNWIWSRNSSDEENKVQELIGSKQGAELKAEDANKKNRFYLNRNLNAAW